MTPPGRSALAGRLARRVLAVELPARAGVARRVLAALPPAVGADLLEELLDRRARAEPGSEEVLAAVAAALSTLGEGEVARGLYGEAKTRRRDDLRRLLMRPPPRRTFNEREEPVVDREMREEALGRRKSLARTGSDVVRGRLLADPDPAVIRILLQHPRLTEGAVVRLAARRPGRPEILAEVFRSPRWSVRAAVRRALVHNPYTPTEVALKAVFLLTLPEARAVAEDGAVHDEVRRAAQARVAEAWRRRETARAAAHLDEIDPAGES